MLLVTGASGFLGSTVANLAKRRGMAVRGLVRQNSDRGRLRLEDSEIAVGDMTDGDSLCRATHGATAAIHCAATTSSSKPDWELSRAVNIDGMRSLIEACREAGVRRLIQISTQSSLKENPSAYGQSKYQADQLLRESDLEWTILRPGLIYGPGRAGVFEKVVEFTEKFPFVPVLGDGRNVQRPVHVDEVAWATLRCLEAPGSIRNAYDLGGAEPLEFNAMIRAILEARGRRKPLIHIPLPVCMILARILALAMSDPPVTADHVLGVRLAPHLDNEPAERDLDFRPRTFQVGLREIFGAASAKPSKG